MRIAVDAFGGDNAPLEIIKGAALAAREYSVDITLTGNEKTIREIIAREGLEFAGDLKIIDTDDVISMHDEPTSLVKAHKDSSMAKAFYELAEGRADAFVSAGSTGAVVVGGTLIVKRIKGIKRPALAGLIPAPGGTYMLCYGYGRKCRLPPRNALPVRSNGKCLYGKRGGQEKPENRAFEYRHGGYKGRRAAKGGI